MRELSHCENEWSLMYHSCSPVSTRVPQLAKVSVCKTNRLTAVVRGINDRECGGSKYIPWLHMFMNRLEQRVSKRGSGFNVIRPYVGLNSRGHVH